MNASIMASLFNALGFNPQEFGDTMNKFFAQWSAINARLERIENCIVAIERDVWSLERNLGLRLDTERDSGSANDDGRNGIVASINGTTLDASGE